jgi:hypothetical protein
MLGVGGLTGVFVDGYALCAVDAAVATAIVSDITGYRIMEHILPAKQLDTHEGAGKRGIGGGGKNGYKAEAGKEIGREVEQGCEGVAECCADKKQGCDLATLKTHAECDGGKEEFP